MDEAIILGVGYVNATGAAVYLSLLNCYYLQDNGSFQESFLMHLSSLSEIQWKLNNEIHNSS